MDAPRRVASVEMNVFCRFPTVITEFSGSGVAAMATTKCGRSVTRMVRPSSKPSHCSITAPAMRGSRLTIVFRTGPSTALVFGSTVAEPA